MNTGIRADGNLAELARPTFHAVADEVARLAEQDMPPGDFFRDVLKRALPALSATAGAAWMATSQGNPLLLAEVNLSSAGINNTADGPVLHDTMLRVAFAKNPPSPGVLAPHSTIAVGSDDMKAGNPTDCVVFLVPVAVEGKPVAMLEIWHETARTSDQQLWVVNHLGVLTGMAGIFMRNHRIRQMTDLQQLWGKLESFTQQIHASLDPLEVSYTVANEGWRLLGCDRLSVVHREGGQAFVEAMSGAEVVEKRSNLVRRLAALTNQVMMWNEKLVYSGTSDPGMSPKVREALDAYLHESNTKFLVIMPVRDAREKDKDKPCRSALVMECFETAADPQQMVERLEVIGRHSATALYSALEHYRIPFSWAWRPIASIQDGLGGKTPAIISAVIIGVALLLAALIIVPYPLKMDAKGQLLPQERAWVFSPVAGHVVKIEVEPSDEIHSGQNLILMHDLDLELKLITLNKEIEAAEKEIEAANARYDMAGTNENERRTISVERQKQMETRALTIQKRDLLRALTNSEESRPGNFWLKSPRNGTILNSNFKENLTGKFVKPSDPLLRVGERDGPWEIELKVPQKHIGQVLQAYAGNEGKDLDVDLLLLSEPTRVFKGKLARTKIAGEATVNREDSGGNTNEAAEPVVIAVVRISGDDIPPEYQITEDRLLTGTEVHARIRCGSASLGYSLFYGVWEFLYEKVIFAL